MTYLNPYLLLCGKKTTGAVECDDHRKMSFESYNKDGTKNNYDKSPK